MMPAFGANTWIWRSPLTDDGLRELIPRLAGWGFEVIELPVEQPGDWDPGLARELLDEHGLDATVCAVMGSGRDLTRPDAATREATRAYLHTVVEVAVSVGAVCVAGPMYAPTGETWQLDTEQRDAAYASVAEGLAPVAAGAAERDVALGIEALNRYETSLINTVAQGLELVDRIAEGRVGLTIDTFHANIEEQDPAAAVRDAAGHVAHVQASGATRGIPGRDAFDWTAFRDAVGAAGYLGPWCIESFTPDNATIARAASIWRPLAPTQDAIATEGLAFLRELHDAADPSRTSATS